VHYFFDFITQAIFNMPVATVPLFFSYRDELDFPWQFLEVFFLFLIPAIPNDFDNIIGIRRRLFFGVCWFVKQVELIGINADTAFLFKIPPQYLKFQKLTPRSSQYFFWLFPLARQFLISLAQRSLDFRSDGFLFVLP